MLERDGGELARATTIVRFAPGSRFPGHEHGGGEEIFVLEGVLCDEHGRCYLRNPIGSSHTPFSEGGCVLLVKLCQMSDAAEARLAVDSNSGEWQAGRAPGLERMTLYLNESTGESVALVRFAPGTALRDDLHSGGEELLVLEGVLEDQYGRYPAGTWLRQPDGSSHDPFSGEGCLLWVKRGHLPPVAPERAAG